MQRRALTFLGLLSVFVSFGCGSCRGDQLPSALLDASPAAAPSSTVAADRSAPAFPLSRPFAATLGPQGDVYVAGLIASRGVVALARVSTAGETRWVREVFTAVAWAPEADVRIVSSREFVAVAWHGPRDGTLRRELAILGADGSVARSAERIAGSVCATEREIAWVQAGEGPSLARWAGAGEPHAAKLPSGDLVLACGRERIFVLDEADEDIGLSSFSATGTTARERLAGGAGDDDDAREREAFTDGDDFGYVRVLSDGAIALREATPSLAPWRRIGASLRNDDDVVAVDADARRVYVVYSREADKRCDGASAATDVRMLAVPRGARTAEGVEDALVAEVPCGTDPGPFFTGTIGRERSTFALAWAERGPAERGAPPISALAWRTRTHPSAARRVQPSDGLSFAGCDDTRCYVVALVRTDADAMAPGSVKVLALP